jgi:hypothetical protein
MSELQQYVAQSADAADLHATVPTLLLELQTMLGSLAASATAVTERGRRPFRPGPDWAARLGELAYGLYLVADQSGVDIAAAVSATAANLNQRAHKMQAGNESGWPFEAN